MTYEIEQAKPSSSMILFRTMERHSFALLPLDLTITGDILAFMDEMEESFPSPFVSIGFPFKVFGVATGWAVDAYRLEENGTVIDPNHLEYVGYCSYIPQPPGDVYLDTESISSDSSSSFLTAENLTNFTMMVAKFGIRLEFYHECALQRTLCLPHNTLQNIHNLLEDGNYDGGVPLIAQ